MVEPRAGTSSITADRALLFRGTLLNLAGLVLKNVAPVLVIVLARVFDDEVFGIYLSLHLLVLAASRLVVFGLDRGLIWRVPRNQRDGRPLHEGVVEAIWTAHGGALLAWGLASAAIAAGALTLLPTFARVSGTFVVLQLFSLVPYMALHTCSAALEGARRPEYRVLVNQFLATSLGPILSLLMHLAGVGDLALPLGYTLGNSLAGVVLLVAMARHFPGAHPWRIRLPERELLRYSVPLGVSEAIAAFLLRLDQWLVLLLLGGRAAAVYGVMGTLSSGVKSIRQSYDPLVMAIVSRMHRSHRGELREVCSYAINMVTALQFVVAIVVLFFAPEILGIAGKGYVVEPQALSLLLAGNLLNGLLGMSAQVIMGLGRTTAILVLNVATLLLNLALSVWLIPRFGIAGAAGASAASYLVQGLALQAVQYRLVGQHLFAPHLWLNFALVGVFCAVVLAFQYQILALPFLERCGGFAAIGLLLVGLFWVRRDTFSVRRPRDATPA